MNSSAKKKKIKSDFDEEQRREYTAEISDENIETEAVPLEEIGGGEEKTVYENTVFKPKKRTPSYAQAKVAAAECSAAVCVSVPCEESITEKNDGSGDVLTEETQENFVSGNQEEDNAEETESRYIDPRLLEELEILANLSDQPPETVFKPNYISCLRYRWGNSPVGDDGAGNYWKYGYMRY